MAKSEDRNSDDASDSGKHEDSHVSRAVVAVAIIFVILVLIVFVATVVVTIRFVLSWTDAASMGENAAAQVARLGKEDLDKLQKHQRDRRGSFVILVWLYIFLLVAGVALQGSLGIVGSAVGNKMSSQKS